MKLFGTDIDPLLNQLRALIANVISWLFSFWRRVPDVMEPVNNACVMITGPGGSEKLQLKALPSATISATVGKNSIFLSDMCVLLLIYIILCRLQCPNVQVSICIMCTL